MSTPKLHFNRLISESTWRADPRKFGFCVVNSLRNGGKSVDDLATMFGTTSGHIANTLKRKKASADVVLKMFGYDAKALCVFFPRAFVEATDAPEVVFAPPNDPDALDKILGRTNGPTRLIGVAQLAKILNKSERTVRRMCAANEIDDACKVSGVWVIPWPSGLPQKDNT